MGYWKDKQLSDCPSSVLSNILKLGNDKSVFSESIRDQFLEITHERTITELIYHSLAMGYWKELMTDSSLN